MRDNGDPSVIQTVIFLLGICRSDTTTWRTDVRDNRRGSRFSHPERRHRPDFARPRRVRRAGTADTGPDRPPHRVTPLLGAPNARASGAAALAAPQWSRLRARHAPGGAGLAGRASGPSGARRPAAAR